MKILDEYQIEEDPRLRTASKEMLITLAFGIVYTLVYLGVAWSIGMSKPVQEYSYILGFPAWLFWAMIVCPLAFFALAIFIVTRLFKDVSLEPWVSETEAKEPK